MKREWVIQIALILSVPMTLFLGLDIVSIWW